jgi:hypothetical protein
MLHRLPFPLGSRISLFTTLFILLVSLSHCQKRDETPPPPKVAEDPVASVLTPLNGEGLIEDCVVEVVKRYAHEKLKTAMLVPRGTPILRMKESWTTALMLGACTTVMAEEIGMTPDGNGEFIGLPAG